MDVQEGEEINSCHSTVFTILVYFSCQQQQKHTDDLILIPRNAGRWIMVPETECLPVEQTISLMMWTHQRMVLLWLLQWVSWWTLWMISLNSLIMNRWLNLVHYLFLLVSTWWALPVGEFNEILPFRSAVGKDIYSTHIQGACHPQKVKPIYIVREFSRVLIFIRAIVFRRFFLRFLCHIYPKVWWLVETNYPLTLTFINAILSTRHLRDKPYLILLGQL